MTAIAIIAAANWLTIPVAGALVCLLTWSWPQQWRAPMLICRGSRLLQVVTEFFTRFSVWAFTWGPWMFLFPSSWPQPAKEIEKLKKHEASHAWWALSCGLVFFALYGLASLWAVIRGEHWYEGNVFEQMAVKAETKP